MAATNLYVCLLIFQVGPQWFSKKAETCEGMVWHSDWVDSERWDDDLASSLAVHRSYVLGQFLSIALVIGVGGRKSLHMSTGPRFACISLRPTSRRVLAIRTT